MLKPKSQKWTEKMHDHLIKAGGAYEGPRDVLILAPRLDEGCKTGLERECGELTENDIEMLRKENISDDCWDIEVNIIRSRFLKNLQTLESSIYKYDRDECDVYSILNVKADVNMTVGSATKFIIELLQNTNKTAVLVCYFGNGQENEGSWCFKHGYITFEDILRMYKEFFAGKLMTVLTDCPFSYRWIQKYQMYLDRLQIRPCGHYGRKQENFLQIISTSSEHDHASPTSDNIAAVRAFFTDSHDCMQIHPDGYEVGKGQHLSYCTPYAITCKAGNIESPCLLHEHTTWCKDPNLGQKIAFLRDENKTRWAYVQVFEDQNVEKVQRGHLKTADEYKMIIKEGGGSNPPMHTRKEMFSQYPLMTRITYDDDH